MRGAGFWTHNSAAVASTVVSAFRIVQRAVPMHELDGNHSLRVSRASLAVFDVLTVKLKEVHHCVESNMSSGRVG